MDFKKTMGLCSICVESLGDGCVSISCGHVYHRSCLTKWLARNKNCPKCRQMTFLADMRPLYFDVSPSFTMGKRATASSTSARKDCLGKEDISPKKVSGAHKTANKAVVNVQEDVASVRKKENLIRKQVDPVKKEVEKITLKPNSNLGQSYLYVSSLMDELESYSQPGPSTLDVSSLMDELESYANLDSSNFDLCSLTDELESYADLDPILN